MKKKKNGAESFVKILVENFPKLIKDIDPQVQKALKPKWNKQK